MSKEIFLPTGTKVVLGESNAEFEGILTRESFKADGTNIPRYLSALTKIPYEVIMKWPLNDKYYALIASRIEIYGPSLEFNWVFSQDPAIKKVPLSYTEDLMQFIDGERTIKPYPLGNNTEGITFITSTGRKFRFDLLNTTGEISLAKKGLDELSYTSSFSARFLSENLSKESGNDDWVVLQNYSTINPREAFEIRKRILELDPAWDLFLKIEHPTNKAWVDEVNLIQLPDFLVPLGI